ncbi:hypothetical protein AGRA3207_004832 [Actinomadura graeca]|uniref:Uncharacterized protein n=1 Tax=Actinomadura graeca TaxID=2750812 RepID=A0ABX8R102_9ACTN|nr:hypothetical protein [Actinomadura graeca]QXJ23647.1 hypothetical protein AGRA3207_004832 [Actinomadura graeca]
MITLKAALIAASAVGTVAVGGGATWAMTGSHQDAGLQSENSKTAAVRHLKDVAPSAAPTCLPAKPALPGKPGLPKTKLPDIRPPHGGLPDAGLPKTPGSGVPGAKLPEGGLPGGAAKPDLPKGAPTVKAPKPGVHGDTPAVPPSLPGGQPNLPGAPNVPNVPAKPGVPGKPGVPAKLPTCLPDIKHLPKGAPSKAPSVPVPAKPGLPAVPALDCSKLPPAVTIGGPAEKAVILTRGLHHVSTTRGSKALEKKHICAVTQKWTGKAGQWLTVERLKTPAGLSQNELRKALALPGGGAPVTVAGVAGWQGPGGNGVLLFDPSGYSLFVNGSPVLAGGLQDVAAALRQAR